VCIDPVAPLWLFIAQEFELRRPHQMALAEVRIPSLLAASIAAGFPSFWDIL